MKNNRRNIHALRYGVQIFRSLHIWNILLIAYLVPSVSLFDNKYPPPTTKFGAPPRFDWQKPNASPTLSDTIRPDEESATFDFDGLISDDTRTKFGRDFYRTFYQKWTAPALISGYNISIKELPINIRFVRIEVYINRQIVANISYVPTIERTNDAANQAIDLVLQYLESGKHLNDGIGKDDLFGTEKF